MPVILRIGSKGALVRRLQMALVAEGHLPETGADGDFGPGTQKAVRALQAARGLPETGVADPATIEAMSLDPETLEDLIEMDPDEPLDADEERVVEDYVDMRVDFDNDLIASLRAALESVETVLQQASSADAKPEVMGSVLAKLAQSLVKDVLKVAAKSNPWWQAGSYVVDALLAADQELKRAGAAAVSVKARDWIVAQREALDRVGWEQPDGPALRREMERGVRAAPDRAAALSDIADAESQLRRSRQDNIRGRAALNFELTMYESWINAHAAPVPGQGVPGAGVLVIFDTDSTPWELKGVRLICPYNDKISDRLGQILSRANKPGPGAIRDDLRPFAGDLRIPKCVAFGHADSDFVDDIDGEDGVLGKLFAVQQWAAWFDVDWRPLTEPQDETSRSRMQSRMSGGRFEIELLL